MPLLVAIVDNKKVLVSVLVYQTQHLFAQHIKAMTGALPPANNKHLKIYKISKPMYKKFHYVKNFMNCH